MRSVKNSLLVFDCDGVLVDSESIASAIFAEHLSLLGVSLSVAQVAERFTGLSLPTCARLIEQEFAIVLDAAFFDRLQQATYAAFTAQLQPVTGIVDALIALREVGYTMCVASSGGHDKMRLTLKLCGLQDFFDGAVFSASEVARGKPFPDLFLYAVQRMGFLPAQAVVIEDSAPGVAAARAANIYTIGYRQPVSVGAGVSIAAMAELPGAIAAWQQQREKK